MKKKSFSIFHFPFSILNCTLYIISALLLSCSSTTGIKHGTITGQVTLINDSGNSANDPVDFSGINIELYKPTKLDTTIVRLNQQYPFIGIQISQETEFDHRQEIPFKITTTDAEGKFNLSKVPEGTYNLVASKPGWGWKYAYNVQINSTHNLSLYPETVIPIYNTDYLMQSDHHYLVTENTTFQNLTIADNAWLRIAPQKRIDIHNQLIRTGGIDFCYIGYDSEAQSLPSSINITSATPHSISKIVFIGLQNGLRLNGTNSELNNLRFINCSYCLEINNSIFNLTRCVSSMENRAGQSIGISNSTGQIEKNILMNFSIGISVRSQTSGLIKNNYISSSKCIEAIEQSNLQVYHNELIGSDKCINLSNLYQFEIQNNNFTGNQGVYIFAPRMTDDNYINYNNFNTTSYALYAPNTHTDAAYTQYNLNCTDNYFYFTSQQTVLNKIYDQSNNNLINTYSFNLGYEPYHAEWIFNAGLSF